MRTVKQIHECLSTRSGLLAFFAGVLTCIYIIMLFSDQSHLWPFFRRPTILQYSTSDFSDNIARQDYHEELTSYLPIDVVYTWVNGSDPILIESLNEVKRILAKPQNTTVANTTVQSDNNTNSTTAETSITNNGSCILSNCVPFNVLVLSYREGIARAIRHNEVLHNIDSQQIDKVIETCQTANTCPEVVTFVKMTDVRAVQAALSGNITYEGETVPAVGSFVTTEKVLNSIPLTNYFIISGIDTNSSLLIDKLNLISASEHFTIISAYNSNTTSIVVYKLTSESYNADLVTNSNHSTFTINAARIVWKTLHDSHSIEIHEDLGDYSSNRFEDNEELRYSIRSVLKFAPWVRHIYIVTNGQLPYWLDLSHPRVTIVPHHQIFQNLSHLPTFSSPAIESHIHRIPGLSKKFLYMNDDVMLGMPVWPEDFYSHKKGQKVYLSWSVPHCRDGCPPSWVGDGYCDSACNNSDCEQDAGDCNKTRAGQSGLSGRWGYPGSSRFSQDSSRFCAEGCPNSWLGDRYCDSSCFLEECAFDSGDCGVEDFFRIHRLHVSATNATQLFEIPADTPSAYINLTDRFPKRDNWTVLSGTFHSNRTIRTSVYSSKHHTLSITFHTNLPLSSENSTLYLKLSQNRLNGTREYLLCLNISWALNESTINIFTFPTKLDSYELVEQQFSIRGEQVTFLSSPEGGMVSVISEKGKHSQLQILTQLDINAQLLDFFSNATRLSHAVRNEMKPIITEFENGILTRNGFIHRLTSVLNQLSTEQIVDMESILSNFNRTIPEVNSDLNTTIVSRKLQNADHFNRNFGNFGFGKRPVSQSSNIKEESNNIAVHHSRKLMDTFGESLRYVNQKYSKRYGYESRKVPAHMPHLIDRDVMQELQDTFQEEFDITSSHKVRHNHDMQYSFSYFYYYMSETMDWIDLRQIFDEFDSNENGLLSILEQRNLVALLYNLPLSRETMNRYYRILNDCSSKYEGTRAKLPKDEPEVFYGENLPLIDIEFFAGCSGLIELLKKYYSEKPKHKFEIMNEDDIAFKMINQNSSKALGHLDWIRKNRRKFICINDNIDHATNSAFIVKSIIKEFYVSLFPIPTPFELPLNYRNRFKYYDEYMEWKSGKDWIDVYFKIIILIILVLIFVLFFYDKLKRRICRFDCILFKLLTRKQKKSNYLV